MQRVANRDSLSALQEALRLIPKSLHSRIQCDLLLGVSPVKAGLFDFIDTGDGRNYHDTACVFYGCRQQGLALSKQRTTLCIPVEETPETFVHEFGHVLDETLGFEWLLSPICQYAKTNRFEAFACAFTAFIVPHTVHKDRPLTNDEWLFFDAISRGSI